MVGNIHFIFPKSFLGTVASGGTRSFGDVPGPVRE